MFADSICTLLEELSVSHESIRNSRSMRLLDTRLNSDNTAERIEYNVKLPRGSEKTQEEFIMQEEKRALDEVQGTVC